MKHASAALLFPVLLLAGCGSSRPSYATQLYVSEALTIRMPSHDVEPFITQIQNRAFNQPRAGLDLYEWFDNPSQFSIESAGLYQEALDDAHRKANTVAQRLGTHVGAARAIIEFSGNASAAPPASQPGTVEKSLPLPHVLIGGGRPVILAVTYNLTNGATASVFGISDTPPMPTQGVRVNVSAHATTSNTLRARLDAAIRDVHDVAHHFNLSGSAISLSSFDCN